MKIRAVVIEAVTKKRGIDMPKAESKVKPKRKKKQTSFSQFDMGVGARAAKRKTRVPKDARTITGKRLTSKQRKALVAKNRKR